MPAGRLAFTDALDLLEDHLSEATFHALEHAQACYHAALPLYAMGGKPPEPPRLADLDDDD